MDGLSPFFKKKYVLSKIDECSTATDVVKSVNIHIVVRWVPRLGPWLRQKPFKIFQEGRYLRPFYGYGHLMKRTHF